MQLFPECFDYLRYRAFWEQSEKPSLKSFLDFRLQEGDLEREETEHSRYKGELNTILNYHAKAPEIREEVQQMLRNFQDEKKSKEVNCFWDLQVKQQNIDMNLKLVEKRRELLEKEQDELKDRICLEQTRHVLDASIETRDQCLSVQKTFTRKRLLDESSERTYKESQRQTRHGRKIPNYRESDESEYDSKKIRRESNTRYSQVTESKQSATLYLTSPMTEVTESSSSNSNLGSLDRSKNKSARSQYVRDDFSSRESTPCPSPTRSVTNTLIRTPNKPIITKATYNEFSSAHIICAFNSTIHLVKATIGEQMYEKSSYSEIESRIISETKIDDNQTSDGDRFLFFVRYALLDFVSKFKFMMPKVLDRDMLERSYIIEVLSPILLAFRKAFPDVKYMWVEKDVRSIKEANTMFKSNLGERKTDLLILRLSDARELLNVEVSGPPYKSTKKHTVGDVKKLLIMAVCSLNRLLGNNLNCNIEDAKNVKTYSIQVIGDRLTLFSVSLADKMKYLAVELVSCIVPFAFDAITCYMRIFNFFAVIRNEFVEQEKLQKKIRSFIPGNNCSENLREWLHLPDNDISLVTEEDMDEIFL
ncbi:hypothetical protein RhiirC2_855502 [Rhizophagus irregularis]|uniref:Uncharacterized protein n=1 Tax=Rhizophagus irregularis TaxID=588596 RepID=A0A2N1MM06_9GLOM|nr:hypothetical protein RhiirC2_855502 [Rhizophagus irregularis]